MCLLWALQQPGTHVVAPGAEGSRAEGRGGEGEVGDGAPGAEGLCGKTPATIRAYFRCFMSVGHLNV